MVAHKDLTVFQSAVLSIAVHSNTAVMTPFNIMLTSEIRILDFMVSLNIT